MVNPENNRRDPSFKIIFDSGIELQITPRTSSLYLHRHEPWGDNIYVVGDEELDESVSGRWVFREQLPDNFERVISRMVRGNFAVFNIAEGVMRKQDRDAYELFLDRVQERKNEEEATRKMIEAPPKPLELLSPRRERFLLWFMYNLDNNLYNWDEEGDLEL